MATTKRRIAALVVLVLLGTMVSAAGAAPTVERLAGPDRYATAAAIAAELAGDEGAGQVILARNDHFADALSAVNIHEFAPILLTGRVTLPTATRDALETLGASSIMLIGGPAAISTSLEDELKAAGHQVDRIGGEDRYVTASLLYGRSWTIEGRYPRPVDGKLTAVMASGEDFADALAAGPIASGSELPLLLTAPTHLPDRIRSSIELCGGEICLEQVILVGGTKAIGPEVEAELIELGLDVRRIGGANRQETAVLLAEFAYAELGWEPTTFNLTRSDDFPDAMTVGKLGASEQTPTLFTVSPTELGDATRDHLRSHASTITSFRVIGSETVVSQAVVDQAMTALNP